MARQSRRPGERTPHRVADYIGGKWVWVFVALVAVVALSVRFALQSRTSTSRGASVSTTTLTSPPSTAVSTTTVAPTTSTTPGTTPGTTVAPGTTPPPGQPGVWTVPDEVGNTLSAAKSDIESVTDGAVVPVRVSDAGGQGRRPIIHQNWQVCAQDPPAGSKFTAETGVTFEVVKTDETCPDNGA
ncbi:MAG: hypothetical protein JST73_12950 [Actinobacteria bacterium]|nr:hypothetical protein [Actinomycetota bacterium]